jgi:hypothetical protein
MGEPTVWVLVGRLKTVGSRRSETKPAPYGVAHGRYKDADGWDENMWAEIRGSLELMLELAGAMDIRVRLLAGGGNNDGYAESEGQWR